MTWTLSLNLQTDLDSLRTARRIVYDLAKREGATEDTARSLEAATGRP